MSTNAESAICTANGTGWGSRPNPLMNPDCTCAACVQRDVEQRSSVVAAARDPRRWLRASGRRQRARVEVIALGSHGRKALG